MILVLDGTTLDQGVKSAIGFGCYNEIVHDYFAKGDFFDVI